MSYVLGVDLGTSGLKCLLMHVKSNAVFVAHADYVYAIPHLGWAEQDVEEWWRALKHAVRRVIQDANVDPREIAAISFSGQMHGLVPMGADGRAVRPAIIWCDQRSKDVVARFNTDDNRRLFTAHTGNRLFAGFALASLIWMAENEPHLYKDVRTICCPKDYLRYRLTGSLATEQTDASSTGAFDVEHGRWSDFIIDHCNLNPAIFPAVHLPADPAGTVLPDVARELGLAPDCTVYYGGSDQVMQALGNGIMQPGPVSVTIGTGGQVLSVLDSFRMHAGTGAHTFCFQQADSWYFLGATLAAGQSLRWLKNNILKLSSYDQMNLLAEQAKPGSDGLVFLPYLVGERTPHADPLASGMFFGLRMKHDQPALIRSVMEGVAFSLKDSLNCLSEIDVHPDFVVASGGGAASLLWLQIQADIFNLPIYISETKEQAALGAAMTAAVAHGYFSSFSDAAGQYVKRSKHAVEPKDMNRDVYDRMYDGFKELYKQNKQLMRDKSIG